MTTHYSPQPHGREIASVVRFEPPRVRRRLVELVEDILPGAAPDGVIAARDERLSDTTNADAEFQARTAALAAAAGMVGAR